jgi:hypothetical protein
MSTTIDLIGQMAPMRVRLDRGIDRNKPCHQNIAVIRPGKPPHAAALHCETCGAFRGWLRAEALTFIETLARQFSAPIEPLILRDTTIGDHVMEKKQYDNSGILFKNEDKTNERDRDYQGSLTVNGVEFWLSAWIKQGQRGKFMSLALKPKDESFGASKKTTQAKPDYDDQIPF